jgi:hypothetical protein
MDRTPHGQQVAMRPILRCTDEPSLANAALSPMNSKHRLIRGIGLFGAGFVFAAAVISAQADGLTFDAAGNLFAADGHSVSKFAVDGTRSTFATGLKEPLGLSFDSKGNLFVSDLGTNSIYILTPAGEKSTFASGISSVGMAFDRSDNLLFITEVTAADASSHAIFEFSADGTKKIFASTLGFDLSSGLACDRSGNVFVLNRHSILKFASGETPSIFASKWVSPDKKWEYRCVDGHWPELVKADTAQIVLDLSKDQSVLTATEAEIVWAPDSKRFAFNYSPPHAPHTSYETTALYQLHVDEWVALDLPVDEKSERTQLAQLTKEHLPKTDPTRDILRVRNWSDANTAILYAYSDSVRVGSGSRSSEAGFLFTLKFDAEGNSKIVKTLQMSDQELKNLTNKFEGF